MKRKKILVAEDEFIVAFELKVSLQGMGYAVCGTVSSGLEAIACAERDHPDCALMDVSLKGEMDGIEAARRIQSRLGVRTVFLSGFPAEELRRRAADVRPIDFLVKPLNYERLREVLAEYFLSCATGTKS